MSPGGTWAPLLSAAYRVHSIEASDRAERTMEGLLTSYLILTGGASDLSGSESGPLIELNGIFAAEHRARVNTCA
jgi:hypothetical protein